VKLQSAPSATDTNLSFAAPEFVWNAPDCSEAHEYLAPATIRLLRESGARMVLDLGCGNGAFTALLREAGFEVAGCDLSASGIALAQVQFPDISFFQQDLSQPLPEHHAGRYDAVVSMEVIEHLLLPRILLRNALLALRPGGLFVLSTPFHGYWKNLALALVNKFDDHWHPLRDFGHVKFFSKKTLFSLFREHGLKVERFLPVGRLPLLACSMIIAGGKPE
jgi:2-polyprenyl-3-methyl-5-hydroxy-6-metoxy-1,4-benzoquinol methylase